MARRRYYEDDTDEWDNGALRYESRKDWMDYKRQVAGKHEGNKARAYLILGILCFLGVFLGGKIHPAIGAFSLILGGFFVIGFIWNLISGSLKRNYWR
jgi:hypothetical protein